VTFHSSYQGGDKTYSGTFYADPLYGHVQSDPHDIAVVVFDKPNRGITPPSSPPLAHYRRYRVRSSLRRWATALTK
jgi:hypothetical protein